MTEPEEKMEQAILTTAHFDYQKGLNARAFFKIHDHNIGEDMVQDTFMRTWMYIVKGGKIEVMKAFLYHILNNLIIDEYRKHKTTSLDSLMEKGYEPAEAEPEYLINMLDNKSLMILIASLPQKYQNIMRMKYIQLLSLSEMSVLTGQTKNAIAVQVYRGLKKLKVLYKAGPNF